MQTPHHLDDAANRETADRCDGCGGDRGGSLFACPHCGDGSTGVRMEMHEDEVREYEYAKCVERQRKSDSIFNTLVFGLFRGVR
jgi:hypothetical protein